MPLSPQRSSFAVRRSSTRGVALVITLALISVVVLLVVAFVSMAQLDRTATASYSKSVNADQLALSSLNLLVAQLQMEMSKDALPDTTTGGNFTNAPIYTNVTTANIEPQATVTNASFPTLVKMSTNGTPFFTGTLTTSQLMASSANSTTASANGREVSSARWAQSYFGTAGAVFANAQAPCWVIVTRGGPTNAAGISPSFGSSSGNTLNNPAAANTNFAVGRYAYAIYNEGGLLDVTAAGSPLTLTAAQQDKIKGMLQGADLTLAAWSGQITSSTALPAWRNPAIGSGANSNVYLNQSLVGTLTNSAYASTNAAGSVYPGDSTFLSRQDLINAMLSSQVGLTVTALPNLTTFSRELNQPSWSPTVANAPGNGATGVYVTSASATTAPYAFGPLSSKYSVNANTVTASPFSTSAPNPNTLVPLIRMANANASYMAYHDTGVSYSDPIAVGDPVVRRRFSLARLAWLSYAGPAADLPTTDAEYNAAGTDAAILSCFGLVYAKSMDPNISGKVWQYVGSAGATTEQTSIETLYQVAQESTPREPNFFELLQAGVLAGSLAADGGGLFSGDPYYGFGQTAERFSTLQILRIGANIIGQYNPDSYPRVVEYTASNGSAWIAAGIQNLPYLNVFRELGGLRQANPADLGTSNTIHYVEMHYLFGLWNPHQQYPSGQFTYNRPAIRLALQTNGSNLANSLSVGSAWATHAAPYLDTVAVAWSSAPLPFYTTPPFYGYTLTLSPNSTYVQLASGTAGNGVNGFYNPGLLTSADVGTVNSGTFSSGGLASLATPYPSGWSPLTLGSTTLFTYELPDLQLNFNPSVPPAQPVPPATDGNIEQNYVVSYGGQGFQVYLEYNDAPNGGTTGNWIPYNYWNGINDASTSLLGTVSWVVQIPQPVTTTKTAAPYYTAPYGIPQPPYNFYNQTASTTGPMNPPQFLVSDPRTFRFNPFAFVSTMVTPMDTLWSGVSSSSVLLTGGFGYGGLVGSNKIVEAWPNNLVTAGNNFWPAMESRNHSAVGIYPDPDGVQRIADSGINYATASPKTAASTGNPFYTVNSSGINNGPGTTANQTVSDRPIILNRPFNHVADLGYAFRDDPWRSIDFYSVYNAGTNISTSADSGLLDLFSVHEQPPVLAGRIDLNTQNTTVLQSVLSQTVLDPVGNITGTSYSTMAATTISPLATQMAAFTKATPLVNKDQIVTQLNPALTSTAYSSTTVQDVKATHEAFVRTLADVGQTRTWNLMIDVIAQAGRYPPNASSLDNFVVEGEKRYWLHVAIDRFTGNIIDKKLEAVTQ